METDLHTAVDIKPEYELRPLSRCEIPMEADPLDLCEDEDIKLESPASCRHVFFSGLCALFFTVPVPFLLNKFHRDYQYHLPISIPVISRNNLSGV